MMRPANGLANGAAGAPAGV